MIDIALSNYNSQGIQKILEEQHLELQVFLHSVSSGDAHDVAQELVGLILSEHCNVNSGDC